MARLRHPNKHIDRAIEYAVSLGWTVEKSGAHAHAWGRLFCPHSTREGCIISVWSTPRVPENHARQIRQRIDGCPHGEEEHEVDE